MSDEPITPPKLVPLEPKSTFVPPFWVVLVIVLTIVVIVVDQIARVGS